MLKFLYEAFERNISRIAAQLLQGVYRPYILLALKCSVFDLRVRMQYHFMLKRYNNISLVYYHFYDKINIVVTVTYV